MSLASIDLNYVNLVDVNFDNDYPEIITHIRIMGWCNRYEQSNACKKEISNELMPVVWHHTEQWDWCMSED